MRGKLGCSISTGSHAHYTAEGMRTNGDRLGGGLTDPGKKGNEDWGVGKSWGGEAGRGEIQDQFRT